MSKPIGTPIPEVDDGGLGPALGQFEFGGAFPRALTDSGLVLGFWFPGPYTRVEFLARFERGTGIPLEWTDLSGAQLGVESLRGRDVNDSGLVVGNYMLGEDHTASFQFQKTAFPPQGIYSDLYETEESFVAVTVNDDGVIAGHMHPPRPWTDPPDLGEFTNEDGYLQYEEYLDAYELWATSREESAQRRAFVFEDGELTILTDLRSYVIDINNRGTVLGTVDSDGIVPNALFGLPDEPVLWRDGMLEFIPEPAFPVSSMWPRDINDRGDVLLFYRTEDHPSEAPSNQVLGTMVYRDGVLVDLQQVGNHVGGINNRREVIANALGKEFYWSSGATLDIQAQLVNGDVWNIDGPRAINHDGVILARGRTATIGPAVVLLIPQ